MKGKKRKGADGPKQPNPKQPKPKPKDKPDDLGWVGPISPQGRALKERLKERAKSRIQFVKCYLKGFISSPELRDTPLESPEWQERMAYHRHVLTGVLEDVEEAAAPADSEEPEDPDAPPAITKLPLHRRILYAIYVNRCLEEWQDPNPPAPPPKGEGKGKGRGKGRGKGKGKGRGKGPRVPYRPPPFILTPMAGSGTHFIEIDTRALHGVCSQLGLTTATAQAFEAEHAAYSHWDSVFKVGKLANRGFVFDRRILIDGVSVCVQYTRPLDYTPPDPSGSSPAAEDPSGSSPAAGPEADPSGSSPDPFDSSQAAEDPSDSSSSNKRTPADIGSGLADERGFLFDPATQMGMGLDPGAIQAVSAASGMWHADGLLQGFYRSKLTRSQVQHDSGLIQARRNTQWWNENVKLELQHLAAATPAGTSLVAIQRHVAVTLATWDAVWGEYLHPVRNLSADSAERDQTKVTNTATETQQWLTHLSADSAERDQTKVPSKAHRRTKSNERVTLPRLA
ncbi:hypothetical protein QJQ45_021830 [Haematococcus lacustris]|nr:hypothetical protein QJQ45_021830 [Haematococcus lacustris]